MQDTKPLAGERSERLTNDVLARVRDGFVAIDVEGRFTYINRRAAELMARTPAELLGKNAWSEFPEAMRHPFRKAYERAMAGQTVVRMDDYYPPWDRWFETRIYPYPDGASIFFTDITERRRAEEQLRASTALLEGQNRILEAIAQGAPLADTLDSVLRLIEAHEEGLLTSILLLDPDGIHVRHGAAPSLPQEFVRAIDGLAIGPEAGSCGTAAFRGELVIAEDVLVDPLWTDYRDLAIPYGLRACWSMPIFDAQRRVLGTFAIYSRTPGPPSERHLRLIGLCTHIAAIAITKHREGEALRRREQQLADAQRVAQIGSYEWDAATDTVERSDELCRIFGVEPRDFPTTLAGYLQRVHPDDRGRTRAIVEQAGRDRVPFDFEERIVRPDGTVRRIRSQGAWAFDAGGHPVKLVGICQDITERALAEERLRQTEREASERQRAAEWLTKRNEELTAFAYTVSHDLKAPLRAIAGYARELRTQHLAEASGRVRHSVEQIVAAAQNLEQLIEDLLRYSRVDTQVAAETDVDLARLVERIVNLRRRDVMASGAAVDVSVPPMTLSVWERGLEQVLANLIDNALKYSRRASPPRVRIAAEPLPDTVRITVSDNGIGFDMKHHERLFGLFTRLVPPDEFEGAGAGLAIARKLTEKMRGTIRAESQPGAGATFVVEVPRQPAPGSEGR